MMCRFNLRYQNDFAPKWHEVDPWLVAGDFLLVFQEHVFYNLNHTHKRVRSRKIFLVRNFVRLHEVKLGKKVA